MIDAVMIIVSALVGTIWAGKVWRICQRRQMIDTVSERSSHTTPTPRGGGLAFMVPTTLFALFWLILMPIYDPFVIALIIGSTLIGVMGWYEDNNSLPALLRFGLQLVIVSGMVVFLPPVFADIIGFWPDKIIIVLAWVWFINLYNFMDGLNTFATAEAIFLAFVLSILSITFKPVLLILLGCCIGFLRVNKTPARLFMGDVGSLYLGTLFGGVMFYEVIAAPAVLTWVFATLTLLFTFDATFTLIKRTLSGKKPWQPHKEHLYQRHQQLGFSHEKVTLRGVIINIILLTLTVFGLYTGYVVVSFTLGLVLMFMVVGYIRHMEGK